MSRVLKCMCVFYLMRIFANAPDHDARPESQTLSQHKANFGATFRHRRCDDVAHCA